MVAYLPNEVKTVLDVGCSNGEFGAGIKRLTKAEVWGIEPMIEFASEAEQKLDKVLISSVEAAIDKLPGNYFDAIYFNDVLEHLLDPYTVLEKVKSKLKDDGKIISSIPNIRYFRTFFKLLFKGEWEYQDEGILDRTHLRFFTKKSIWNMYENAGYIIEKHEGINGSSSLKPLLINIPLLFRAKDMKYTQFATVARKK
ncbi:MAG: class I SAM-dependent methyltransferase [Bacteroidia bacterium]|nr:class I SAM-dependent methyltransferase [Bacteroidia bacterium]MBT8275492.1 class I SAM-dependent methyltransferase [Bacteroidia bacterium]NNF30185.1 class I SAM-dependent methyltransferase [Flavobacteriaceae bacterium]NNK54424.1 class I SAM-dependent methyltransferase [Flavobacteriaceae bacterium]NNM09919.1 class I SAM-dependent methyltransferase [Flavobacteriaceae bacterium]